MPRSKGAIALSELDRLQSEKLRFGTVLADAGYGGSAAFRHGLDERGLRCAVGIASKIRRSMMSTCNSCRRRAAPVSRCPIETPARPRRCWRRVTSHRGTKGKLSARFAMTRMRVGDGPVFGNNRHLPGDEVWLVDELRSSGERKFYLSNLPPRTSRRALAGTIKARWVCEQAHQQMKEELGLDHFEGRSWTRLHRHALLTCIACAYLQHLRLAQSDRTDGGKTRAGLPGPLPSPSLPAVRQAIIGRLFVGLIPPVRCPHCRYHFRLPSDLTVPR